jgi:hypothetical protein
VQKSLDEQAGKLSGWLHRVRSPTGYHSSAVRELTREWALDFWS